MNEQIIKSIIYIIKLVLQNSGKIYKLYSLYTFYQRRINKMDYEFFREFEALKQLVIKHEQLFNNSSSAVVENDKVNAEVKSIKN